MNQPIQGRREFLVTVGALGAASTFAGPLAGANGAAAGGEKLALDGGTPVRTSELHHKVYGPQFYDDAEKRELLDVLEARAPSRWQSQDSKVLQLEKEYAKFLGVKHVLAVTSGTTALFTAVAALEIGPGDEVILPAWTWSADYDAIVLAGALPVFVEIDESLNIDPTKIEAKITPRTKAIIVVHLQGTPADMDPILEIARKHKIRVLEDCAQCVGGRYKGRPVGSMGDINITSFQYYKTITAGEGGAVHTNSAELFERAIRFHDCGAIRSPYTEWLGGGLLSAVAAANFRMNEFTGAVLKAQVQKLEMICNKLRDNTRKVREGIADLSGLNLRKSPDPEGDLGVTVFLDHGTRERRDRFLRALRKEGIAATGPSGSIILPIDKRIENKVTIHPDWPTFNSPQGQAIRYGSECCPRTIDILGRQGGLIMDPKFSTDDVNDIVAAIRKVYTALPKA